MYIIFVVQGTLPLALTIAGIYQDKYLLIFIRTNWNDLSKQPSSQLQTTRSSG